MAQVESHKSFGQFQCERPRVDDGDIEPFSDELRRVVHSRRTKHDRVSPVFVNALLGHIGNPLEDRILVICE